ncbi:MAG: glycosyltransferase family 1 protein [Chloroflexi bacterium]|nr:MAG: glycosyltransferase family 1 protein [Chloroflexota bacterium]
MRDAKKMNDSSNKSYRIAVVKWSEQDEMAVVIEDELKQLNHSPFLFHIDSAVPQDIDILFTFAPYGSLQKIILQLEKMPAKTRPVWVHWNTEGLPDLRLPWAWVRFIGKIRTRLDRSLNAKNSLLQRLIPNSALNRLNRIGLRYRYVGDYYYAYRRGLLNILADSSEIYADIHTKHGIPVVVAPWGATSRWYADLNMERDIDVLWMGKRGSKRRSDLIDYVDDALSARDYNIHIADNETNPFIFGDERTEYLNRAKIALNITRTWFDDNFSRFAFAVPNRSLVVSEPLREHCTAYKAGVHYVSASKEDLVEQIEYYLQHDEERSRIVENAFELSTKTLTFNKSIKAIIDAGEKHLS